MASLKEIKGRIGSVEGTLKITSAMKMVASAKLHKAQQAIESMLPYNRQLQKIMQSLLADSTQIDTPLCRPHAETKRIAIVAVASNSSLCGGYNNNILRHTVAVIDEYRQFVESDNIECYAIGRKLEQALGKHQGFRLNHEYADCGDHPSFATAQALADRLVQDFLNGQLDCVELVYSHFKSTACQIPTREVFLPLALATDDTHSSANEERYIIEPSPARVLEQLLPDALSMKIFTMLLDAQASEHAARTVAMQTATDNANDLLDELRILYNKGRQSAITAELLDIVGGSMQ